MVENKYLNLLKAAMAAGISMLVGYMVNLLLTPYIVLKIGTDAYGYCALAKQFTEYAAIITIAINSFVVRYVSIEYRKENYALANSFFSSGFFGNVGISVIIMSALIIGLSIAESLGYKNQVFASDIKITFYLVFISFIISNILLPYSSASYITHKLQTVGIANGLAYVMQGIMVYLLFRCFDAHIYYVAIGALVVSVVISITDYYICKKYTPQLRASIKDFDISALIVLFKGGIWNSINLLGEVLNHGLDLLICNIMLTPRQLGQLAIAKMFQTMFQKVYVLFDKPFQPIFLKYYSEGDNEQLLKEFNLSMKLSAMATNVGFAGMGALGRTFFKLWLPGQDTDIIYTLTIITILTIIPGGSMHPLYYIYTLTVKQKIPSLVTICGGLFNVVGMVVAIKYTSLGIYAVVWTTVIVMYVINFITNPLYMARVMNYKWNAFYPGIIRNLISELAILGVFFLLSKLLRPTNFWQLGISAVILLIIGIFIHFSVAMSKNEKEQAIKFIVRAINK